MLRTNVEKVLARLELGGAGESAVCDWVARFEARDASMPILVLSGPPGKQGTMQALARAIGDESGEDSEDLWALAAVEESRALPNGAGEFLVISGSSSALAVESVREDAVKAIEAAVQQEGGPRWVVLIAGSNLGLPASAAAAAVQITAGEPVCAS